MKDDGEDENENENENEVTNTTSSSFDQMHLLHAELHREEETKKKAQELHAEFEGHEQALH